MGGGSTQTQCSQLHYTPGVHPGVQLLPPADILTYPTLPATVVGKISIDGLYYDHYGKFGVAFEDSMIDAPDGQAKKDWEEWLKTNPDIAAQIDTTILRNKARICNEPFEGPKSEEEKAKERMTEDQERILPTVKGDTDAKYKKDYADLGDLLTYNESEWKIAATDKEDRDQMVVEMFAALNNKDLSPVYKSGVTFKLVGQYMWKRYMRTQNEQTPINDEVDLSAVKDQISKALQAKFMIINQEKVVEFKNTLAKEVENLLRAAKAMAFPKKPKDFTPLFNEYQELFFKELEEENMKIYERVTEELYSKMVEAQQQGKFDATTQKKIISDADKLADSLALANYQVLSKRFIVDVQTKMSQDIQALQLMALKSSSAYQQKVFYPVNLQQLGLNPQQNTIMII